MDRDAKIAEAKRLRAEGLSYRAIGERLGVNGTTANRWLQPDLALRHRRREKQRFKERYPDGGRAKAREYGRRYVASIRGWAVTWMRNARRRAEQKQQEFALTLDDVVAAFPADRLCPVFGVCLNMGRGRDPFNPSVDRLDNARGYVPGNIAVISRRANLIKNDATAEELRRVADWLEASL